MAATLRTRIGPLPLEIPYSQLALSGWRRNAGKTAIIDVLRGREVTFSQLEETVRRVAGQLQRAGVGNQVKVQFYADNSLPAVVALQAAFFNNATVLLFSPDETVKRDEYGFQTKEAEVEYVITDSKNFNLMVREYLEDPSCKLKKVLLIDGSLPPGEHARVALINELPDGAYVEPAVRIKKDVLILLYTSGSTGLPKGVMHSHYSYVTSLQIMHHLGWYETYDRVLVTSSLTYVSGLILHGGSLAYGATLLLASSVIEVDYPRYAELYKPTISLLLEVPARNIVTNSSRYRNAVEMVSTFRLMLISGTVFPEKLRISVQKLFTNVNFVQLYGMTEAIGAIVASDPQPVIPISAGYAVPNVIIRVLNESGKPVKVGEPGEVYFNGAQKTLGYWKRMTDDFTEDGFYRTGDIGVIDVDGQLNLLGRNKQFIICLDSRVSPMEIENVLLEHPAVAEAVVVGVPHPHYQEAPTALVVTKGRISKEHLNSELVEFVAARLVEYKQLHGGVFFTDELEKTRSGKYSRGAIEKTIRRLIEESKSS